MKDLYRLQQELQYEFQNISLLREALTHRSYNKPYNNERLEFIGDSILNFCVASYLYNSFPNMNEGSLSKLRSTLVSQSTLYRVAQHFSLGKYLRISEAEERNSGRVKKSLLSNSVEAILGAIYFDSDENVGVVQGFVTRVYEELFPHISLETMFRDFKTTLQEITQSQFGVIPEYKVISTSGPDHEKLFDIGVYIDGKIYGKASGKTKKSAEQSSAEQTILMLEEDTV